MNIELREIEIRDLIKGYEDKAEGGVLGYGGRLDIRPPYQREFIYKDKQREAVIDTVSKCFPLNVMYWAACGNDKYEVIDGQQRTISICQFVDGDFSYKNRYFHNLHSDEREQILGYKLMIYVCSGSDGERLEWFKTINIAGEKLTDQELRNAVYSGSWVGDAKRYFSKTGCAAYGLGGDYLNGSAIRQDYLETAISWASCGNIEDYMATRQNEPSAAELWHYFEAVIGWTKTIFPIYRKEMKGIQWGVLYNLHKDVTYDHMKLEAEIATLMQDEDVSNKKGVYEYLLTGKERYLNIRSFTDNQKREAYERQKGICPVCSNRFDITEMEGDHITPWHAGGKTAADNCQMLCREDNRRKSGK
jgi:hypothetical protein